MKKSARIIYFMILTSLVLSVASFAYLDPATLTYLIQIVAGVFIAGGAAVGIYWKKIKLFFKKQKAKKNAAKKPDDFVQK